jgi:acyl-CoA synthetase (AMP-forming)/AMP-acid ligase II
VKADIAQFIRSGGDFDRMALRLYAWQRAHNPDYDRFCGDVHVRSWTDIPAVPTPLFQDIAFTCFDAATAQVVFRTSGTTLGRRGVVRLLDTAVYDLGSRLHAERCLGPLPTRGVSLVSTAEDSSLGHMCSTFVPEMRSFFSLEHGVDSAGAWAALAALSVGPEPIFVPGTAFAFADWLDHPGAPVPLPPGSIAMVTGGFKGRRSDVSPEAILQQLSERLPGARIVGEYGMSELSSQLWADPVGGAYRPPPWMRVVAVDPGSGATSHRGQLRFFDLANHQTVVAIETQDEGTVHEDGSVTLHGRLAGHMPRGCSLTVEEARDR